MRNKSRERRPEHSSSATRRITIPTRVYRSCLARSKLAFAVGHRLAAKSKYAQFHYKDAIACCPRGIYTSDHPPNNPRTLELTVD